MVEKRETFWQPWMVGLAVFIVVMAVAQMLLSGGALLVAVPVGLVAGAVHRRYRRA